MKIISAYRIFLRVTRKYIATIITSIYENEQEK